MGYYENRHHVFKDEWIILGNTHDVIINFLLKYRHIKLYKPLRTQMDEFFLQHYKAHVTSAQINQ